MRARFAILSLFSLAAVAQPRAGSWNPVIIPTAGDPSAVAIADLNHDGRPDIVAANENGSSITVLLNDGGRFHPAPGSPFPAGHLPADIAVGDLDRDGHPDLVIANHQTPHITVLMGDGTGRFHPAPGSPFATKSSPHPHGVALGNFCGPAKPLAAVTDSWGTNQIELLPGDGKGALSAGPLFFAGPGSDAPLRSADFNGDGKPDIVMVDTAIGKWHENRGYILLGDGNCGFHPAPGSPFAAGEVPWSVATGDLNGDGIPDLVILPYGPQVGDARKIAATVLLGNGKGSMNPLPGSPLPLPGCPSPHRPAIGDVNGDGIADIVVTCMQSDSILVFLGRKGGGFSSSSIGVPGAKAAGSRWVALADLTGKGSDDIVLTNAESGSITIFLTR